MINVFFIPSLHLASSLLLKELKLRSMTETKGIAKEISKNVVGRNLN